jgi:hypothetical protein
MNYSNPGKQEIHDWFCERFVVPEACDPRESPISGYQYSCGGPYFAKDIIRAQFSDSYRKEILDEIVSDLEAVSAEWARRKVADYPALP